MATAPLVCDVWLALLKHLLSLLQVSAGQAPSTLRRCSGCQAGVSQPRSACLSPFRVFDLTSMHVMTADSGITWGRTAPASSRRGHSCNTGRTVFEWVMYASSCGVQSATLQWEKPPTSLAVAMPVEPHAARAPQGPGAGGGGPEAGSGAAGAAAGAALLGRLGCVFCSRGGGAGRRGACGTGVRPAEPAAAGNGVVSASSAAIVTVTCGQGLAGDVLWRQRLLRRCERRERVASAGRCLWRAAGAEAVAWQQCQQPCRRQGRGRQRDVVRLGASAIIAAALRPGALS